MEPEAAALCCPGMHKLHAKVDGSCNCLGLLCDVPDVAHNKPCSVHVSAGSRGLSVVQAPGAQCNDQGFFQLPTTTKALVLSLPNFTLATAAAVSQTVAEGAAARTEGLQWVCRSRLQPCMLLDLSTKALSALSFGCKNETASIASFAVAQSMQPCHCI